MKNFIIIICLLFFVNLNNKVVFGQKNGTVKNSIKHTKDDGYGGGICSINDLNQDGFSDIVVGKPSDFGQKVFITFLNGQGQIQNETIIKSNSNGFDTTLGAEDQFGQSITNLGDVNGDGIPDIAVGAPSANYSGLRKGAVWLLFLKRDGTVKNYRKIDDNSNDFKFTIQKEEYFGSSLGTLRDWNNNGVNELLVGSPSRKENGSFWILFLDKNGQIINQKEFDNQEAPLSNFDFASLGSAIDGIGDLNNDGHSEIMVGDNRYRAGASNEQKGAVFTLFLNKNTQNSTRIDNIQKLTQGVENFKDTLPRLSFFGTSLHKLGDINGDKINDVAVGSDSERYPNDSNANLSTGKVRILFMKNNGTIKSSQAIGNNLGNFQDTLKTDDLFGRSLTRISDLNYDTVPELAVGAPGHGANNEGSVFILFLNGVPQSSGIREGEPVQRLKAYPNPLASAKPLRIQLSSSIKKSQSVKVTVFDMQGRQVHKADFTYQGQREIKVDLPKLSSGTYQLYMKAGEFQGFSKIVVE